ncbi:D-alanine--poly(phosphoribitol) ligase subunit DltA [Miniphocaeibacter massiliensis]|uniref:D-alanine--poly(phosphoribitol) ligase subunit DltA n=1 Tax=Miniphocaeibacter massiliensis TaxID=2041841 RepID=UPI000C1BF627|nr:D-alanine--poly(phosphoribitol) ligase subunit DltA [Miniphocaeibacter massiliensis]
MWTLDELYKLKDSKNLAITNSTDKLTFKELWDKSDILANYIIKNTKEKSTVMIYGDKEIEFLISMIASLKAGRSYSPMNISFPIHRVKKIIQVLQSDLVINLSEEEITGEFKELKLIELKDIIKAENSTPIDSTSWVGEEDTAYIIFTSGSTGEPKGVPITKKNIETFTHWFKEYCILESGNYSVLDQAPYSFDLSVIALYVYLPLGAKLVAIDKATSSNLLQLFKEVKEADLNIWISTPSMIELCCYDNSFNSDLLPNLKKLIFIGEVLTKKLSKELKKRFKDIDIINGYGPTEATCGISACYIDDEMINAKDSLPIGKPGEGIEFFIEKGSKFIDKDRELGELVCVGDSVSKGYYKNSYLSDKVFFKAENGKMAYRTGDIVYKINDTYYFKQRKDFQVKLNGFRIELDDITNNLNKIEYIDNSITLPAYEDGKITHLVSYVTLNDKTDLKGLKLTIDIKKKLKEKIQSYMVPKKIIVKESFPLNTNGKIDRNRLLEELN